MVFPERGQYYQEERKNKSLRNKNLVNTNILFSAFEDDGNIIPVKLSIKRNAVGENILYLTVALSSIKKADVGGSPGGNKYRAETLVSASEITLADLFSKINLVDEDFLKYIPDRFLDKEQLKAKANAVEKERKKIARLEKKSAFFSSKTDQAYRQAVESGDLAAL